MGKVGDAVKSVAKGISGTAKNLSKGNIGGALKSAASAWTLGVSDMLLGEQPQVNEGSAVDALASEAESTAKKRKSLYFTEGEELGQDVTRVFNTQSRGSIFK